MERRQTDTFAIVLACEDPVRVAADLRSRSVSSVSPQRWLYLGGDYESSQQWAAALGSGWERTSIADQLQDRAREWRSSYLDWIASLGRGSEDLAWWTSPVAERNTMTSWLFQAFCYLDISRAAVTEKGNLLIVAQHAPVLKALRRGLGSTGSLRWIRTWRSQWHVARPALVGVYRWLRFGVDALQTQFAAWQTRREIPPPSAPVDRFRVLLHTCIDESYFDGDGHGRDRYFPALQEHLTRLGYEVVTIPWLSNLQRSRQEAFRWFRRRPGAYLIPEDYYRARDYLWSAWIVWQQRAAPRDVPLFRGMDVSGVVRDAYWAQLTDPSRTKFIRYYRLIQRLSRTPLRVDVFVDMFENLASEKPIVLGFRRWMPHVMTVGYQHYLSMYPSLFSLFTSPKEVGRAPIPDVLVASSYLGAEQLVAAGFPEDRVRVGPSLRFQHILCARVQSGDVPLGGVLVVVPMERSAAAELIAKLRDAFRDSPHVKLWLKLHPMMSDSTFHRCLNGHQLLPSMVVVKGRLDDWVDKAACAIVLASSAALEVALLGLPVVVVGREGDLDFNPLDFFPECVPAVVEVASIRNLVLSAMETNSTLRASQERWAASVAKRAVVAATEVRIRAFVTSVGSWHETDG